MTLARQSGFSAPPTDAPETLVDLHRVHKSYRRAARPVRVLDGLCLQVRPGEFLAVSGPSGSGKSTLLHVIGGLDVADAGVVRVAGVDLRLLDEEQRTIWRSRSVGFVFQQFHLIPVLSALENVELPLRLFRMGRRERRRRAALALDLVGLADRLEHRPAELSGGQEQRVAVARAMVTDPPLILADEPTGDLDAHSAERVVQILAWLAGELGKAVILATHDARAAAYASRCCRLTDGTLRDATPAAASPIPGCAP